MKLSKNFNLSEFTKSSTAARRNIDNSAPEQAVENLKYLVEKVLQPIRDHFNEPLRINSGYRSAALNKAVGGSNTSHHSYGNAADIEWLHYDSPYTLWDIIVYIYDNLPYTELIFENAPDGWVHVALAKGRENEKALKLKKVGEGVKRVTFEELEAYAKTLYK